MLEQLERFADHALGRPYHAALMDLKGPSQPHGHRDYFEVMAVVDGAGEHHVFPPELGMRALPLRPGDVVLVRPRDQHAIVGPVQFYNVAFPATAWRAFVALAKTDPGWELDPLPPQTTDSGGRVARACAQVLETIYHAPGELDLIRFWTDVVPPFISGAASGATASAVPDWLATATAAMGAEENLRDGVPRLLELAHVSPAHLARSMRRHYGMTPSELVADVRLRHAATLLASTTRPIADIAYSCGFASPSYFARCFRQAHGTTPRGFRHAARQAFVPQVQRLV